MTLADPRRTQRSNGTRGGGTGAAYGGTSATPKTACYGALCADCLVPMLLLSDNPDVRLLDLDVELCCHTDLMSRGLLLSALQALKNDAFRLTCLQHLGLRLCKTLLGTSGLNVSQIAASFDAMNMPQLYRNRL